MRLLLSISLLFMALSVHGEGIATWLIHDYDFGTFKEESGKVSCEMKMVNTGDSVMRITSVRSTCGCTASSYTKGEIHPGDTAAVTLTYNPSGRPGRFEKDVYVYTDGAPKRNRLVIRGNVIGSPATIQDKYPIGVGALRLSGKIIPFGEILKGKSRIRFIDVYNQSDDTLKAIFDDVPKHIKAEMVPDTVMPGEQATITVTYHSGGCNDWGLVQDVFSMETLPVSGQSDNAVAGIGNIEVTAIVMENFSGLTEKEKALAPIAKLSTSKVDFGRMNVDEDSVIGFFEITNTGKSKLKIRRIYTLDKGVSVSFKKNEIKPGKTEKIHVAVKPYEAGNILNAKLMVITNDPENSQQTVRLVGMIENDKN